MSIYIVSAYKVICMFLFRLIVNTALSYNPLSFVCLSLNVQLTLWDQGLGLMPQIFIDIYYYV